MNLPDLQQLADDILSHARIKGASSAEVTLRQDTGLSATARMGDVETLEYHQGRRANVTLYCGQGKGSASSSDFAPGALQETVAAAAAIARYTAEDEYAGLADADRMVDDIADLELDHPWELTPEEAIGLAIECENTARGADARIVNSEGASVASFRTAHCYANTHGFAGGYYSTRHRITCSVVGELEGAMQRDYWYSVARSQQQLEPPQKVGEIAAQRTLLRLGATRISTRTAPVIFAAEVARGLLGHFSAAIAGQALYRKSSFLLDHLGKQVFPRSVRIHEQPHLKAQLGSAPFDREGVATQTREIVSDGVLQG
ncbi:MAG: metallopeptidase TldD-related protein, partial [Gammaproteobacteria bacterium]